MIRIVYLFVLLEGVFAYGKFEITCNLNRILMTFWTEYIYDFVFQVLARRTYVHAGNHSLCHPISEVDYRCICESGYVPIENNVEKFGCSLKCGPHAGLVGSYCYCFGSSFEENRGDAYKPQIGCKSKFI